MQNGKSLLYFHDVASSTKSIHNGQFSILNGQFSMVNGQTLLLPLYTVNEVKKAPLNVKKPYPPP